MSNGLSAPEAEAVSSTELQSKIATSKGCTMSRPDSPNAQKDAANAIILAHLKARPIDDLAQFALDLLGMLPDEYDYI